MLRSKKKYICSAIWAAFPRTVFLLFLLVPREGATSSLCIPRGAQDCHQAQTRSREEFVMLLHSTQVIRQLQGTVLWFENVLSHIHPKKTHIWRVFLTVLSIHMEVGKMRCFQQHRLLLTATYCRFSVNTWPWNQVSTTSFWTTIAASVETRPQIRNKLFVQLISHLYSLCIARSFSQYSNHPNSLFLVLWKCIVTMEKGISSPGS